MKNSKSLNFFAANKKQYHIVEKFGSDNVWRMWMDKDFVKKV